MTKSIHPFRINVGFLYNQPKGTFQDFPFDVPELDLAADMITTRITGNIRISRTSEGLLFQNEFQTHVSATCVRCLEEFDQPLHSEFTELFVFPKQYENEQADENDPDFILPNDGYIDLGPLLREYLLLEIPIKPLHHPECKGLCPVCGANWNQTVCEHQSASSAPDLIISV